MTARLFDRRRLALGLTAPLWPAAALAALSRRAFAPLPSDMGLGSPAAKVTVVEYASVGCPICGRWGREVFPAFKAKWVDSGRARFVYREMLVGDEAEVAVAAAGFVLARCAGPANYFPVVEAIYRRQEEMFRSPRATLADIGKGVGVSPARFDACMADDKAFAAMNARSDVDTRSDAVTATPTFVVDGRKMEPGFHTLAELDAVIAKG